MVYQFNSREREILNKAISTYNVAKDKLEAIISTLAAAHDISPPFDVLPDGSGLQTPEPATLPQENPDATDAPAA